VYIQEIHVQHNGGIERNGQQQLLELLELDHSLQYGLRLTSPHLLTEFRISEETVEISQSGQILDVRTREDR
jgi:hypothetical protein